MGLQGLSSEAFDAGCTRCPRLADFLADCRAKHPDHFGRPVAPFGDSQAGLLVVGLAPGYNGANRTGRPFTGDFCGDLLYSTLHKHGFASAPQSVSRDDGLQLINCRVTNAVKCVPPENKPTPVEIRTCNAFLSVELTQYKPQIILALGVIAHDAVLMSLGIKKSACKFSHGAQHELPLPGFARAEAQSGAQPETLLEMQMETQAPVKVSSKGRTGSVVSISTTAHMPVIKLLDSYHVSRYNTQTGRLTEAMFDAVVGRAVTLLKAA